MSTQPYFALVQALNIICDQMVASPKREAFARAITEAVISDSSGSCTDTSTDSEASEELQGKPQHTTLLQIVVDFIPKLEETFTGPNRTNQEDLGGEEASLAISAHTIPPRMMNAIGVAETLVQLKWGLRLTLAAICQIHPLVLILDDLQWADRPSLDIVASIATYNELSNFFLVGAYRDNEVSENHILNQKLIQNLQDSNTTALTELQVKPFDQDTVTQYTAKLLERRQEEVLPLAELIFHKTKGNIFYLKEVLELLVNKNLLEYSFHTYRWEWSVDQARQQVDISDNVSNLLCVLSVLLLN